jgi:hypothetical protein
MRRLRMTTRRWMVLVALAGVTSAAGVHVHRRRQLALAYHGNAMNHLRALSGMAFHTREQAVFHKTMYRKYIRAYERPWLPVAPDPPRPYEPVWSAETMHLADKTPLTEISDE